MARTRSTWSGAARREPTSQLAGRQVRLTMLAYFYDFHGGADARAISSTPRVSATTVQPVQRAMWIDVTVPGNTTAAPAHVAVFDYPDNSGYPQAWQID